MKSDEMLSVLYEKVYQTKQQVEALGRSTNNENDDRRRQVAIEKNALLVELIGIRTDQIRRGSD